MSGLITGGFWEKNAGFDAEDKLQGAVLASARGGKGAGNEAMAT